MKNRPAADRFGNNVWLKEALNKPAVRMAFSELPSHWRQTDLYFICDKPAGFVPGTWMARSVRGALGRLLIHKINDPAERALPATSFEALFQNHFVIDNVHGPKPFRVRVMCERNQITVRLRLFGCAELWRDNLAEAMVTALAGGIGLWENGRILRPWPLTDWWWTRTEGIAVPPWQAKARIVFETPFKPGSSQTFAGDFSSNFISLATRVRGLARWSLIDIKPDAAMDVELRRRPRDGPTTAPGFDGFIKRATSGDEAVVGLTNQSTLIFVSENTWPLVMLGSETGAGGHAIYGFGDYRLIPNIYE